MTVLLHTLTFQLTVESVKRSNTPIFTVYPIVAFITGCKYIKLQFLIWKMNKNKLTTRYTCFVYNFQIYVLTDTFLLSITPLVSRATNIRSIYATKFYHSCHMLILLLRKFLSWAYDKCVQNGNLFAEDSCLTVLTCIIIISNRIVECIFLKNLIYTSCCQLEKDIL